MKTKQFAKFLSIAMLLIVMLSVSALAIEASEKGSFWNAFLIPQKFEVAKVTSITKNPRVKGVMVEMAATTPSTCLDSEGGINYDVKGTCQDIAGMSYSDNCDGDLKYLNEWACNTEGGCWSEHHLCPGGCQDGVCIASIPTPPSCFDSDGGRYYHVKGYVEVNGQKIEDFCDYSTLSELLCYQSGSSWTYATNKIACPNGCSNGACNPASATQNVESMSSCTDTDAADDVAVKGSVSFGGLEGSFDDTCGDTTILRQRSCYHESNGSWNYITVQSTCQTGTICQDGICTSGTATTPPVTTQCGNGVVETGEECDDGNTNNYDDGCLNTCVKCAAPGLRADIYGGVNQKCCAGLVLEGGVCNVSTPTPTPEPTPTLTPESPTPTTPALSDLAPGMVAADTSDFELTICNKGTAPISSFDFNVTANGVSKTLTYAPGLGATRCATVHTWGFSYYNINAPWSGNVDVSIDPLNTVSESNETNNTLSAIVNVGMPGIPVPEPIITPTSTPPVEITKKFAICHYNEGKGFVKIEVDENGWVNGHKKHGEDFIIEGGRTCGTPVQQPATTNNTTHIQELLDRIKRLELKLSQLEQQVVEQEKNLVEQVNQKLAERLKGRILLQVEEKGEAWYVEPMTSKKFYLKDGESAYKALQVFGIGITDENLARIPAAGSTETGDIALVNKLKGKILIQVQQHGEAWYVNPADSKRYYLKDGPAAYDIMRKLSLGINNKDLRQIDVGELDAEAIAE